MLIQKLNFLILLEQHRIINVHYKVNKLQVIKLFHLFSSLVLMILAYVSKQLLLNMKMLNEIQFLYLLESYDCMYLTNTQILNKKQKITESKQSSFSFMKFETSNILSNEARYTKINVSNRIELKRTKTFRVKPILISAYISSGISLRS